MPFQEIPAKKKMVMQNRAESTEGAACSATTAQILSHIQGAVLDSISVQGITTFTRKELLERCGIARGWSVSCSNFIEDPTTRRGA
jgi:hypothetical protein